MAMIRRAGKGKRVIDKEDAVGDVGGVNTTTIIEIMLGLLITVQWVVASSQE